jgi:hypothetical protein
MKQQQLKTSHSFLKSKTTMPPNQNNGDGTKAEDGISSLPPTNDVICIADQFHFSSFYSSTNLAGLDDNNDDLSVNTPTPSTAGGNNAAAGGGGGGGVGKDGNSPRDILRLPILIGLSLSSIRMFWEIIQHLSIMVSCCFRCGSVTCVLV